MNCPYFQRKAMRKKITIIGAGNVGASTAQLIAKEGLADVVLYDIAEGMPQGKALDIAEACPLWGSSVSVKGTNKYSDTKDSDIVVITAGSRENRICQGMTFFMLTQALLRLHQKL